MLRSVAGQHTALGSAPRPLQLCRRLPKCRAAEQVTSSAGYNEMMAEKMKWGDNPYAYDFERWGLTQESQPVQGLNDTHLTGV